MEVVYALISRGTNVLAEYTRRSGNFEQVTRLILRKVEDGVESGEHVAQIKYDAFTFHYKIVDAITYMCMTDESARTRLPMCFLDDICQTFREKYGVDEPTYAVAYQYNHDFAPILRQKMEFFLTNAEADIISRVKAKIDETRDELVVAIEQLLERGEKIELLVDKTEQMSEHAHKFERTTTRLKDMVWWKRVKIYLFIAFILAVLGFFIAVMACGISFDKC